MESSSIKLKVLTCKDLKAFNFFQKLSVYALVSIVSDSEDKKLEKNQQQKTPIDREGDGNPEWNHEMRFDLDEASILDCDHLLFHFQLHAEVVVFGDKIIGEVRVPFKDLIGESNGIVRFVSYEVRTSDAKPNGVLNFSYKVNAKGFSNIGNASSIGQIDGYYSVEHHSSPFPSAQVHYPTVEIHSSPTPSSPPVQYPSLDLYSPSSISAVQHTSHHAYYSPPHEVYPPAPPLPPPHEFYPLPPPHEVYLPPRPLPPPHHGPPYPSGFYHPYPPPPPIHQWEFAGGYGSASPGTGWSEMSNNGEMWPSGFQGERDWHRHPSSWNGR